MLMQKDILLSTLNARYIHSAFGLRYLKANLRELEPDCAIEEFTLESRPEDIVETLLSYQPKIVGLGVYIWNIVQTTQVVAQLKAVAPELVVVLGGPEVSYEQPDQSIVQLADYVIGGWGEVSFYELCQNLSDGQEPNTKVITGVQAKLQDLIMPYHLYDQDDIAHRVLYVEASRGCPFKCEFCLSALDKTAWPFDLDAFLTEMAKLYDRGARYFKFVDRTFNLKISNSLKILDFFLARTDEQLFLHFEVIPDHLPDALKDRIAQFPKGSLQFEIGIQTFNPAVQAVISRRQNNDQAKQNLVWIRDNTEAHIHADLIFGLPGESLVSFASSFDQLHAVRPHEIQVGILKRLKGSPIIRHCDEYKLVFSPNPPFSIVSSNTVSYAQVQSMSRFARYWDLVANSGRFEASLGLILSDQPFLRFSEFSQALFARTKQTYKISLLRLFDLVFQIGVEQLNIDSEQLKASLARDHANSGLKSIPKFLLATELSDHTKGDLQLVHRHRSRQARHQTDLTSN